MSKAGLAVSATAADGKRSSRHMTKTGPLGNGTSTNLAVAVQAFRFCQRKGQMKDPRICQDLCSKGLRGYKKAWFKKCHKTET